MTSLFRGTEQHDILLRAMDPVPNPGEPKAPIGALLELLTDESASTQKAALKALTSLGRDGIAALEEAASGPDAKLRARARRALQSISRKRGQGTLARLLAAEPKEPDPASATLIEGLLAIDDILGFREFDAPGIPGCQAAAQIDSWAAELGQAEAWREGPTLSAAGALRRVLADGAGLEGPKEDFHNLQHVSLSRTIITMTGLPLTLSAIYAAVARRNDLEAWLLPFPGQVLLALGPPSDRVILDPFHGGALLSRANCLQRLATMGAPRSPHWLAPADDRVMLERQTRNLATAMLRHGRDREAQVFARLVENPKG